MKQKTSASRLFLMGNILLGVNVPIAKFALAAIPLGPFLILRHLLAGLFLAIIAKRSGEWKTLSWSEVRSVGMLGLINISLTNFLFYYGMTLIPSTHVLLVGLTLPVMVYALSSIMLRESFHRQALIGTVVSVSGVALLVASQFWNQDVSSVRLIGLGVIIVATLTSAYAVVKAKKLLATVEPVQVASLQLMIGALPFTLLFGHQLITFDWTTVQWHYLVAFAAVVLVLTPLSYAFFYKGLKSVHVHSSVGYIYFQTIAGDIVALLAFSEQITPLYIVSMIVVMTGVWVGRVEFGKVWFERNRLSLLHRLRLLGRLAYHRHGSHIHILKNDIDINTTL